MAQPKPFDWARIASFYAGRPVTLGVDERGPLQASTGVPQSGKILLGKQLRSGLDEWLNQWRAAKTPKQRAGLAALGANPLAVLIHEAMHNRKFTEDYFADSDPNTGFRNAGNESQAAALGAELIPDMMQRFFGVKMNSPVSKAYGKAARSRAEYDLAYGRTP